MLELIDLDQKISKEDYEKQFPLLERELGECQRLARAAGVPVLVVFEGWDASGKGTVINRLTQAIDPRGFKVYPIVPPNETEKFHPWMWRFWTKLPAAGDWAIFDCSWYRRVLSDYVEETVGERAADQREAMQATEDIRQFEQQLADGGAVIVKFWLHISKREQKKRFKQLLASKATAWKIGKAERREHRHYDQWLPAVEEMIMQTNSAAAPWTIVEATQRRFARVAVFRTLVAAIREALAERTEQPKAPEAAPISSSPPAANGGKPGEDEAPTGTVLDRVDLRVSLDREAYEAQREEFNERLLKAEHELYLARIPAVICYEGWDAGGKGGNIKRVTQGLDPRGYEVVPIAAPDEGGKGPPLSLAILARHSQGRAHHDLRPHLVRPRAGGAGRGLLQRGRLEAGLRRDQPIRAAACQLRRGAGEILAADRPRGAAPPFPGTAEHALQAVEDHRRRLAEPGEAAEVRAGRGRDAPPHEYASCAVDDPGGQLQVLRADQGPPHRGRGIGAGRGERVTKPQAVGCVK